MINLTIQSDTGKQIKIVDIINNNIEGVITNNETINLTYANYYLDITTHTTSFKLSNIWLNIDSMTSDILFIFIILIIIVVAFVVPKVLKKLS